MIVMYEGLVLLDTSIGSENLGDYIIMESIFTELEDITRDLNIPIYRIPTHIRITPEIRSFLKNSFLKIFGGTNVFRLNYLPYPLKYNQWKIGFMDIKTVSPVSFFGVGTTTDVPDSPIKSIGYSIAVPYSKKMWSLVLSDDVPHSVRDKESLLLLRELGFENVYFTGCPTLWRIDKKTQRKTPKKKGDEVVFTITDYVMDKVGHRFNLLLAEKLVKNYDVVNLWLQSPMDYPYAKLIVEKYPEIKIVPPRLKLYDDLLKSRNVDYVGTRLHGGIRALQFGRRALIIAVDSRALSFGRDFNLPVVPFEQVNRLDSVIWEKRKIKLKLPISHIKRFRRVLREVLVGYL